MPNHVYNTLTIHAQTKEELDSLIATLATPFEVQEHNWTTGEYETKISDSPFSYNNIIPFPTEPNSYWDYKDEDGKTHQKWYDWNINNWGTKWDAYDVSIESHTDLSVTYCFNSAWSPPVNVFQALCLKYPNLSLNLYYEEEQGWGGEMESGFGESYPSQVREWDIPESHADYMALGRECNCESESDRTYWFKDCPKNKVPAGPNHSCNCDNCDSKKELVNG